MREAIRSQPQQAAEPDAQGLEPIIQKVSVEHGLDVRSYKRPTLHRRVMKRMADTGCARPEDYLVRLETDPAEYAALVDTILINVTEFFRDPEAWQCLRSRCIPELLKRHPPNEPIRAWSVGCATGEEAYSIAICLAEHRDAGGLRGVKIYATDVDEGVLGKARASVYSESALKHVSAERRERFFEAVDGDRYRVRRELRSAVVFGRHNILMDPPISRLDLVVCRNLLIYFDAEAQEQLLPRFHLALRSGGYLFLGKAETLMTRSNYFSAVEAKHRLFQRSGSEKFLRGSSPIQDSRGQADGSDLGGAGEIYGLRAMINHSEDPALLLDAAGRILLVNDRGRAAFRISDFLIGRSFFELNEAFRPMQLRVALEEVRATGRLTRTDEVRLPDPEPHGTYLSIEARPIHDSRGKVVQVLVWGRDVTRERVLARELTEARQELETTAEELQTTNEELVTTNEELQSTNEELETTNEELQSTNEELETTIEELQCTNEELETANDELRSRQDELNLLARFQDMVLTSLDAGLIVLDRRYVVTGWNQASTETWGIREEDAVGKSLFGLDIGISFELLRDALQRILQGEGDEARVELDAINRRGQPIRCDVRLHPLRTPDGRVDGVTIILGEARKGSPTPATGRPLRGDP